MRNVLISSTKLTSIFLFIFISCKNPPSKPDPVQDSVKIVENKLPDHVFEPPVLKIGKTIDHQNLTTLGSSIFTPEDTMFVYLLLNHKNFAVENLNLRFYKVLENGIKLLESVNISVNPGENKVSDSFALFKVYDEFGKGEFEMQFLLQEKVIASKLFELL